MSTDKGSFQTVNRLAKTTLRLATRDGRAADARPEAAAVEARLAPLRTLDIGDDPVTLIYKRHPQPEIETGLPEMGAEVPLFEGTLVLPAPVVLTAGSARAPASVECEPPTTAAVAPPNAGTTTLVMEAVSAPMPEFTTVMNPPLSLASAFEATVVAAHAPAISISAGFNAGDQTRIAPIEAWAPRVLESKACSAPVSQQTPASPPVARSLTRGFGLSSRWRALTPINRASVIIAPFTLAAVVAMLWPERHSTPAEAPAARPHSKDETAPVDKQTAALPPSSTGTQAMRPPAKLPAGKTLQRAAADALSEGNNAAALNLYRQLAQAEPDVAAYRAAVRILEERARTE